MMCLLKMAKSYTKKHGYYTNTLEIYTVAVSKIV